LPPRNPGSSAALAALRAIPEETLWVEGQNSPATRRAYRSDVAGFMRFVGITTPEELRLVSRASVLAWKRRLESAGSSPATIRRKLAALTSLFSHLVSRQVLSENPCREVRRPPVNARQGKTAAFSQRQARALLDSPDPVSLQGLRDRAILSLGFQAGPRRASIVRLKVRHLHMDGGFDCLRFIWKGGHEHTVALHPQTAQRIREYLAAAGHGEDHDGPLFRPVRSQLRRALHPQEVDRILKRYVRRLKIRGSYSAHSMRATFITTALANGASLEDVQAAAGHADASTTKLYDRRGYNPEKSAAFFANY
jgi:site-specific recombinase XerD